jgi:hypothetical protein
MKKLFALAIVIVLAFSLLTACEFSIGGGTENGGNGGGSGNGSSGTKGGVKAGDPPDFSNGIEFTAFHNSYDAISKQYDSYFDDSEEYSDNFDYIMASLSRVMLVSGNFLELMLYDAYADGFYAASNEVFPRIPFGFTKTRSGDTVTISIDTAYKTMPDDSGIYTEGDIRKYDAVLDKNKQTVKVEDSFSRNGGVYKRSVFEIVRLSDGSFLAQNFNITKNLDWDTISSSAGFHRIDKNGYVMVIGEFENPDVAFNYTSILDKVDRDPGQMAQNFKVTGVFKVENSKMTFESMK